MTTIKIDLNAAGIQKAITELNRQKAIVEAQSHQLVTELAEEGTQIAQTAYDEAKSFYDETKPLTVSMNNTEGGYSIVAKGPSVTFLEFGAGLSADYPEDVFAQDVDDAPPPIYPGSYSQTIGMGQFDLTKHPYWIYSGKRYTEIQPSMAMYQARKHMWDNIERKAKKVFT